MKAIPPGRLFWEWTARSYLKTVLLSLMIGIVWMMLSIRTASLGGSTLSTFLSSMSFLVDGTFIYLGTVLATLIGMSVQTWDVLGYIISSEKKTLFNSYIWSVSLSMMTGTIARYYSLTMSMDYNTIAVVIFNMVIVSSIGFSAAYRSYCNSCVLDRSGRADYRYSQDQTPWYRKIGNVLIPGLDRNRVALPWLHAGLISIAAFYFAYSIVAVDRGGNSTLMPVWTTVLLMLLFTTWGILRRVIDAVKPGQKERLYPYFETER